MPFLASFTSLFGGGNGHAGHSQPSRRGLNGSTGFDTFNLPNARYTDGPGGVDGTNSLSPSPGPSRRPSSYEYSTGQSSYQPTSNIYPPLSHTFHRLRGALADSFPELLETLNPPVDPSLFTSFERELGAPLPPAVRDSWSIADGQDLDSGCGGLFFGLHLLPFEDVVREWTFWRHAEHDPDSGMNPAVLATMASVPSKWIKKAYACRGWIPLLSDRTGNYIGVDLDPAESGSWGQVIIFGRDFDRKCVVWRGDGEGGWGKFLASFVDELESGDGWEADKSSSSDEEEEVGYGSYNGGATAGEAGKGLRLAGEYRGWSVLEAWWDRSVKQWEQIGLGMDVEDIEQGLSEARRLAGLKDEEDEEDETGPSKQLERTHLEVPEYPSPRIMQEPPTPGGRGDSEALLPPSSPEKPFTPVPKSKQRIPVRIIAPISSASDHPLQSSSSRSTPVPSDRDLGSDYLSPHLAERKRSKPPPPAPTPLDLPTRADIQASVAIAQAEASGLRGGWVMNIDPGINARRVRSGDPEMVDIDLENGNGDPYRSPRISAEEMQRLREEEKLNLAGMDQRSPRLIQTRTPSPLSRNHSLDLLRQGSSQQPGVPQSVLAASSLRRPPPIANQPDSTVRRYPHDEDPTVYRRVSSPVFGREDIIRRQRESSVFSENSEHGLLDSGSIPSRSGSPALSESLASPITVTGRSPRASLEKRIAHSRKATAEKIETLNGLSGVSGMSGLEDDMQDVSLDGGDDSGGRSQVPA